MLMEVILYISFGYLAVTSLILLRNIFEFKPLHATNNSADSTKKVSVCIPARNEVDVIEKCVTSVLKQNYENFEVLVLDDESTDGTSEVIEKLSSIVHNLKSISGKPKPDDWLGKPWACHQLSKEASGEFLIFIDADVWLQEDVIAKTVSELQSKDVITVWPEQETETFWEKQVIPLIYFALYTLLPAKYVERSPRWLPSFLKSKFDPLFAAACGQFIAFTKSAYEKIGGHESVKQHVIEDVELAKAAKRKGLSLKMLHGVRSVYCRMYKSHNELWNGLRKNFFLGFNNNLLFFGIMGALHLVVFVFPYLFFAYGFSVNDSELIILSSFAIIGIFIQRALLNYIFKWDLYSALTHPVGVLWFQALGLQCIWDYFRDTKVKWKDREL